LKQEVSVDLMRFRPSAPSGVMDGLFAWLFAWAKQEGYQWFNLGMAPLSGLEVSSVSPLWAKVGRFVYGHGESFYNFQGLRAYKEKFDPVWEPRYLGSSPTSPRSSPAATGESSRSPSGASRVGCFSN